MTFYCLTGHVLFDTAPFLTGKHLLFCIILLCNLKLLFFNLVEYGLAIGISYTALPVQILLTVTHPWNTAASGLTIKIRFVCYWPTFSERVRIWFVQMLVAVKSAAVPVKIFKA